MSGFISPKTGCKIEDGFTDILGANCRILSLVGVSFCLALITPGAHINFTAKREKWLCPFEAAQPSLFFPDFDFTLMNVYMNTGIK